MIIDVHTHIVPEHFPPAANRSSADEWPYMEHVGQGRANVIIGGRNFRTVLARCWDVGRRLEEMPEEGADRQVLSPMPELLAYQLSPEDGRDLSRHLNECVVRMVEEQPDRFYGLGAVPLQDPEMATAELEGVKAMGLRGVEVMTNINGQSLGDQAFSSFFRQAERLGLAVFVHAQRPTFTARMSGPRALVANGVAFPIENGLAAAALITGGVLQDCPSVRICMSHGGGVIAQMLPRMDMAWLRAKEEDRGGLAKSPTEYARQLYFDDILFSTDSLRLLANTVGISQIMIGSDYPFMSRSMMPTIDEEFRELGLTENEIKAVSELNCLRFLGIPGR